MPKRELKAKQGPSKARLLEGSVGRVLIRLTFPMIFASMAMVAFNLADTFFVGKLGARELAAMSFTFPVVLFVASMGLGVGMGAASVISRAIGEGDHHKIQRLTTDALLLALVLAICSMVFGFLTINPIFRLIGANVEILPLIKKYIIVWYCGLIFLFIPMVGNNAIRATGDTKTPSIIMMVAAGFNIVLDPCLIFGLGIFPRLELAGAALATVISRSITFCLSLLILGYRDKMLDFSFPEIKEVLHSWKQILYIGIPAAATNIMVPISMGIITGLVAQYGTEAVAALGVGSRIESLVMMIFMALSATLIPFIGQNWGAGKLDRVDLSLKYSRRFSLVWGSIMYFVFALASRPVALIFNKDVKVVTFIIYYLWLIPFGNGFQGIFLITNASLNAMNKPVHSAILTVIRLFILYIPLAFIGSWLLGLKGLLGGVGLANVMSGIMAYVWAQKFLASMRNNSIPKCL